MSKQVIITDRSARVEHNWEEGKLYPVCSEQQVLDYYGYGYKFSERVHVMSCTAPKREDHQQKPVRLASHEYIDN